MRPISFVIGESMKKEKARCSKCGTFEVIFIDKSVDSFGQKKARYVCQKCGYEYPIESNINLINKQSVNTFPNPKIDLDVDDPFTSKMKDKFKKEVY